MSVEIPLDLSKVTVANLLNDDAPANAGVLNEKAEVVETTEPESDVEVEETFTVTKITDGICFFIILSH